MVNLLILYVFLVPFYYVDKDYFPLSLILKYVPFIFIVFYFIYTYLRGDCTLKSILDGENRSVTLLVTSYSIVCFLSLLCTSASFKSYSKLLYYTFTGPLLAFLFAAASERCNTSLIRSIVISSLVVASYGVLVKAIAFDPLWEGLDLFSVPYSGDIHARPVFTLGNPIYGATVIAISLPLVAYNYFEYSKVKACFWYLGLFIMLIALVSSLSRGAFIGGFISVMLFLCRIERIHRVRLLALLLPIILLLFSEQSSTLYDRLVLLTDLRFLDVYVFRNEPYRYSMILTVWDLLNEHFALGIGFGRFTELFDSIKHPHTPDGFLARTTENMYLMITAETGVLGLSSFCTLNATLLYKIYAGIRNEQSSTKKTYLWSIFCSIFGSLIIAVSWDHLNHPTIRIMYWLLIGVALNALKNIHTTDKI